KLDHLNEAVADTNPLWAPELKKVNESFRLWVRMRQAGSKATGEGKFSPEDLLRAIKSQDKGRIWSGDRPLQGYAIAGMRALGRERASPFELLHLFHRHGLVGEIAGQTAGPAARAAKSTSPVTSPILGMREAREIAS